MRLLILLRKPTHLGERADHRMVHEGCGSSDDRGSPRLTCAVIPRSVRRLAKSLASRAPTKVLPKAPPIERRDGFVAETCILSSCGPQSVIYPTATRPDLGSLTACRALRNVSTSHFTWLEHV